MTTISIAEFRPSSYEFYHVVPPGLTYLPPTPVIVGSTPIQDGSDSTYIETTGEWAELSDGAGSTYGDVWNYGYDIAWSRFEEHIPAGYHLVGYSIPNDALRIRCQLTAGETFLHPLVGRYEQFRSTGWSSPISYYGGNPVVPSTLTTVNLGTAYDGTYSFEVPASNVFAFTSTERIGVHMRFLSAPAAFFTVRMFDVWLAGVTITVEADTPPPPAGGTQASPTRQLQRGDGLGIGGVPRALQRSSAQSSLRTGTPFT